MRLDKYKVLLITVNYLRDLKKNPELKFAPIAFNLLIIWSLFYKNSNEEKISQPSKELSPYQISHFQEHSTKP